MTASGDNSQKGASVAAWKFSAQCVFTRNLRNARKPLQMRLRRACEERVHAKLNNLFFDERSHQVIENKGSRPKTKPNEAMKAGCK
jgi:hypothetical protein